MTDTRDPLSQVLRSLRLGAGIFTRAEYCGLWAVDTSGAGRIPFHLIDGGTAWLHGADGTPRRLNAGDLVVFPHDAPHIVASSPDTPPADVVNAPVDDRRDGDVTQMLCGYFEFASKASWPILDSLPGTLVVNLHRAGRLGNTPALIQLIVSELDTRRPGVDVVIDELSLILFVHVLRSAMDEGVSGGMLAAFADARLARALEGIHSRPGDAWTLDGLARAAGMSRSSFAERFKTVLGVSPMRYLTEWRMQQAVNLLTTTRQSAAAIAEQSGYASEVAFRKAFRNVIGRPPGAVRRSQSADE